MVCAAETLPFSRVRFVILRLFLLLCTTQIVLWTLFPALFFASPPLDVVENIVWSREWQLGYYKHPPLQAWLTGIALWLSGGAVWSVYFLAQISICITFLGLFLLGRDLYGRETGLKAALLFAVVYYATIPSPEFNANILQMPIWAMAGWLFWRCLIRHHWVYPCALAFAIALAVHAKYSVLFLVITLLVLALSLAAGRRWLKTPSPWLAGLLCLILCVPHLIWLYQSDLLPVRYAMDRSVPLEGADYILEPLGFIGAQALDHIVPLFLCMLAGGTVFRLDRETTEDRFLLVLTLGPVLAMVAYSIINGTALRDMWGAPAIVWISLFLARGLPDLDAMKRPMIVRSLWLFFFIVTPIAYPYIQSKSPDWTDKPHKTSWPGQALKEKLLDVWDIHVGDRPNIIGGPTWEAGLIAAHLPRDTSGFFRSDLALNPWITPERLSQQGALFVWTHDVHRPPTWAEISQQGQISLDNGHYTHLLNWAILMPEEPQQ